MATKHEIRHDRIAKRVFEQASVEQLGRRRVKRLVEDKMFQSTERGEEFNRRVEELENDKGIRGRTWRLNGKLLEWLKSVAAIIPFLLPLSYLMDYFHKNQALFARQFLLAPDELALVDRYMKDIQWEDKKLVQEFIRASRQTQIVKKLLNTLLGIAGAALILLAGFFWWQNQVKETALNERLADYYAQVAETKIGQDSLFLAYRLNKEALKLHPTNAKILRQDSFLQRAVPDFNFVFDTKYTLRYPFIIYGEEGLNKENLNLLHVPTMKVQSLAINTTLRGLTQSGSHTTHCLSQSGNLISWVEYGNLKLARREAGKNTFATVEYNSGDKEKELNVNNQDLTLLGINFSADEKTMFFLHVTEDSLLISSASLTETSINRPRRIYSMPCSSENQLPAFDFLISEQSENYLSILQETGKVTVFKLLENQTTQLPSIQLTRPTTKKNKLNIGTLPNGKGFIFSDDGRVQILYLGVNTYLKKLELYQGNLFSQHKIDGILDLSRGGNLVTLHLNTKKEIIITHFGAEEARDFKTGVFWPNEVQLLENRRPTISVNEAGTLVGLSTQMGSLKVFSIRPDTLHTYKYDFTPEWEEEDSYFDYFTLGSKGLFVHINEAGGYYVIKDGPNGLQKVDGELKQKTIFLDDEQDLIYEVDEYNTTWIKRIDPATNTLKFFDQIFNDPEQGKPGFQTYFGQSTPLTKTFGRAKFSSSNVYTNLKVTTEYGSREKSIKTRRPGMTVLDSMGSYVFLSDFNRPFELIKLLKNPADLPTHLNNNHHLNTWRPGEKKRYGIRD